MLKCFYPVQDPKLGLRPCGMCANCMLVKHMQWKFRLSQEVLVSDLALWVTLQYDDEHLFLINGSAAVNKIHCQNFFRKFREYLKEKELNVSFKYFLVSEYGTKTHRPHYHTLLLFKLPDMDFEKKLLLRQVLYEQVKKKWYHGHAEIKLFHSGVIRYLTKYVFKPYDGFDPPAPLFRLISKGIGEEYLSKIDKMQVERDGWRTNDGVLPRYYRDKLYPTIHGLLQNNVTKRALMNLQVDEKRWNKTLIEERKFTSLEDYIKNQKYLLNCQKRLIERKEKEKYG